MTGTLFVDTSFFLAMLWREDERHLAAVDIAKALGDEHMLVTSALVRGETWTALRRRSGHRPAGRFLDALDSSPRYEVERIPPELEDEALAWLRRHDEREYSFVDATSFALMRRAGITEALAFDGDFSAAGFVERRQ